ncbi:MAG: FeoA family protein [Bacilli bacterium]|nr:FeoA family protein [Bacilli bacterium]MDD4282182.1 FeoA family protein [Bacilli bacterium]MDD4718539.1 FeoA family protein [Bacilli bacterium]
MYNNIPLTELRINEKGKIKKITVDNSIKRRLLDLGLIENTEIEVLQKSPFGDPVAYSIRGAVIALRSEIASNILIERLMG